jgi:hypothetical protein
MVLKIIPVELKNAQQRNLFCRETHFESGLPPNCWFFKQNRPWNRLSSWPFAYRPLINTVEPCFYVPTIYFPAIRNIFSGLFNFPVFIKHCLSRFYVSEIPNFPQFAPLECLQREPFWYKMASAEKLLVSACFVSYYNYHLLVSHSTKMNMYNALQNENGVSCLTTIVSKRWLTMPNGGRNRKWHSLQAGILKKFDE